ncbi:MAG: S8 family serine peptidase [Deltaproteobacteria bacterium]|jgi:subtilisin family serine protease
MTRVSSFALAVSIVGASSVATAQSGSVSVGPNHVQPRLAADISGDVEPNSAHRPKVARKSFAKASKQGADTAVYIVQLSDPAVAAYRGGLPGLKATNPKITGAQRLDTKSKASVAYASFLEVKQTAFSRACAATLGREVKPKFVYRHAFNGMALELTLEEAEKLRRLDDVVSVTRERIEKPTTDVGPLHIGAPSIWYGFPNGPKSKGERAVIAVLDTGINHDHPSFADIGGDGYNHRNPLGSGNYVPGSYCDVVDPTFCNDKLIGAWTFVQGADDPTSPEDSDGHGTHTAGTAAGNFVFNASLDAPTTTFTRDVSGVAPHANLIIYDVCIDTCPGSALLAAINQVVIDAAALPHGIHSLNYSISGGNDPYNDAVEIGFLNATAAGVYVSASAGNSGPGAATTGHNSPWVATTAAMTHSRRIDNSLIALTSNGAPLPDILGAGLTAAYGPAPIVYAGDFPTNNGSSNDTAPDQCLEPFPAGTFSGEIVICDRGEIARVDKGANVLAGGAGGFVLANLAANGDSVVADPHFLPGVHVGVTNGDVLKAWVASNPGAMGSISGTSVVDDPFSADIMASFSSRGPNSALEILVPDIGAPGVSIFAPYATFPGSTSDEYTFLSGTSMSSPHNAGAGALLARTTNWTPYEIRSAMMMTAERAEFNKKEDGVTPADPFDVGAGRINLGLAKLAGLVLDETPANFTAANPETGGDPKTLNIASMQNNQCIESCTWTRTVRRVGKGGRYDLDVDTPPGFLKVDVSPKVLTIGKNQTRTITVTAHTLYANPGWNFATLNLRPRGNKSPNLHMPIALFASNTELPGVLEHTVDMQGAREGDTLSYAMQISNGQLGGTTDLSIAIPPEADIVPSSLTSMVSGGTTSSPFTYDAASHTVNWSGQIDEGGLSTVPSASPFGFFPLASLGVAPFGCPSNCDDGAVSLNVPAFTYNGQTYTSVIWSVNGTLEAGTDSGIGASAANQELPDAGTPNNLLAPLWTDLDMGVDGDGAEWYVAVLNAGPSQFTVYEWSNLPLFGDTSNRYSFQIWVENGNSGNIWFVYGQVGTTNPPSGITVGVENEDGSVGSSSFFEGVGTAPSVGADRQVNVSVGGTATFQYQAVAARCGAEASLVSRATVSNGGTDYNAIATTHCTPASH